MKTLNIDETYRGRGTHYTLYPLADLHVGAAACDERLLRKTIIEIENDENARWIGLGDYIDAIARKGDKRYQEATLAKWLQGKDDVIGQQRDRVCEMLKPIASKCWGLINGNHEHAALQWLDRNVYWEIVTKVADDAGKPPTELALTTQGFCVVKFRRKSGKSGSTSTMVIYSFHGAGGGRLPGGHALALERVLGDYQCDLALLGHRHVTQYVRKEITMPKDNGAVTKTRTGLFCGSYLGAYIKPSNDSSLVDTYAERLGLPPKQTGSPRIVIKPDVMRMDVVLSNSLKSQSVMFNA